MEGWIQYVKYSPWTAQLQFGAPATLEALLAEPEPATDLPLIKAAWRYVRGEAAARQGHVEEARAEVAALDEIVAATDWETAVPWTPAGDVLAIMRHTVLGRAALAEGDRKAAIDHLVQAADIQSAIQYTEPPFWWYPVRQTLAAALLDGRAGRAGRAAVLRDAGREPGQCLGLLGAGRGAGGARRRGRRGGGAGALRPGLAGGGTADAGAALR